MLGIKQEIERQGRYFYLALVRYFTLNMTSKFLFTVVVIFTQMEVVSGYVKEKAKNVAHSLLFVAEIIARWRRKNPTGLQNLYSTTKLSFKFLSITRKENNNLQCFIGEYNVFLSSEK